MQASTNELDIYKSARKHCGKVGRLRVEGATTSKAQKGEERTVNQGRGGEVETRTSGSLELCLELWKN